MHRKAEYGVAAHWRYKNGDIDTVTNQWASQWIDNLIDHHKEVKSVDSFIEILYNQVYKNHIVVFGNAGQIIRFPENATVQDHVKRFNPDSASYFKAKVNEEIARMNQALRDGDTVEIIDDKNPIPREHVGELMRNGQSY
jgi:GTP pyrophosphokinase